MRTQVVIIGSGPAGLLLGLLLDVQGIDTVIPGNRSKEHVVGRIRAGVLAPGSVEPLKGLGCADRWLTALLHRLARQEESGRRLQLTELSCLTSSHAAGMVPAENHAGLAVESSNAMRSFQ